MSEPAYEFGIVCEGPADEFTACALADRVLLERIDWLEPELLSSIRKWRGEAPGETFLKWSNVKDRAAKAGLKVFGPFGDKPNAPDALTARKALLLFAGLKERPAAVLLIRDSDGDPDRRDGEGLKQARDPRPWPFQVLIGVAHPKVEAWVLAGFQPQNPEESKRLQALRDRLSVDPILKSHTLDAREHGAKTDIKRALEELLQGDGGRKRQCVTETELAVLEQRGEDNGLTAYLSEVRERLVPVLLGRTPKS
jgi:hypothetical protein